MANKPIQIDTWTTSEGEFCARFCINRGRHPFGVARGIFRTLSEMHPGEMYELVSLQVVRPQDEVKAMVRCTIQEGKL